MNEFIFFLGILSAYAQGPTDATLAYQQSLGRIPIDISQYDVFLAVDHCGLVGHEATMYVGELEFSALVFDCAGSGGVQYFSDGNDDTTPYKLAADADFYFWKEYPEIVHSLVRIEVDV